MDTNVHNFNLKNLKMKIPSYADKDLLAMIRGTGPERLQALRYIYKDSGWTKLLMNILKKDGIQEPDIKDAIQEGIVILDNHIRNFQFKGNSSIKNFFLGICKKRIYSNNRSIKRYIFKENNNDLDSIENITPEVNMLKEEQKEIIRKLLLKIGEPCKTVLTLYKLSYSMKEIGKKIGKSEGMAKKMSFTCRKKMKKLIALNPSIQNYLKF